MSLYLPTEPLKTRSGLELVPIYEPCTYIFWYVFYFTTRVSVGADVRDSEWLPGGLGPASQLHSLAAQKRCTHRWDSNILIGRKEGNVLFNDALNTFYLRLIGVRHMVKDHSDSERGNLLPPHGLLFSINSKGSFICTMHYPQTGLHIQQPFLTRVMEHWLEREIAQWVHPMKDRSDDPSRYELHFD